MFWRCQSCREEQKVNSIYFVGDGGARLRCNNCYSTTYCHHPNSPFPKKDGEIIAYTKD